MKEDLSWYIRQEKNSNIPKDIMHMEVKIIQDYLERKERYFNTGPKKKEEVEMFPIIKQIVVDDGKIYGLGNDNRVYRWCRNNNKNWILHEN